MSAPIAANQVAVLSPPPLSDEASFAGGVVVMVTVGAEAHAPVVLEGVAVGLGVGDGYEPGELATARKSTATAMVKPSIVTAPATAQPSRRGADLRGGGAGLNGEGG